MQIEFTVTETCNVQQIYIEDHGHFKGLHSSSSAWTFNETNIIMHIILLHGQCILCTDSNRSQWYQSKFATPGIDTFHNFRQQFHCQTLIEGV